MILERGNMWDMFGKTDMFLITTNPIMRKDGCLVMGAGIAKQAATKFFSLPFEYGQKVRHDRWYCNYDDAMHPIHCNFVGTFGDPFVKQKMGYFMVKDHWAEPAKLDIIERSVRELKRVFTNGKPNFRVDLNFPGIGNGKLAREDVLPIISQLPDNVHVWEYA